MLVPHPMNWRSDSATTSRLCLQRRPLVKLLSILTKRSINFLTLNSLKLSKSVITTINTTLTNVFLQERHFGVPSYSYFEKDYRKKCTRQSRKVLWVVLSSLGGFEFTEIWKNGTRGHGRMFASAKGKQQKNFWQLQWQEQCIDHIPYYLSGLSRAQFCRQPFSK